MQVGGSNSFPVSGVPTAGQQAGSVRAAGGDISIPRTAAVAAVVGNGALNQYQASEAAQQQVSSQPILGQSGGSSSGPAAWSDEWAEKFRAVGAPAELIQQLSITGAMGADEAKLGQMVEQVRSEVEPQLAQFNHKHPEAFKKLRASKDMDTATLAQIAAASNSGQLPDAQLDELVSSMGKSQGKMIFDTMIKPMIVWSLIPGWGALRIGFAPFTGGKDILTGEKLFGDPMTTGFTLLAGVGGGMTIYNNVRGAMQVAQAHRMIASAGSDAATIAAREGISQLSTGQKIWSYVPGTKLNQQLSGLSRLDDIKTGISNLKGIQQEVAQNLYTKIVNGDVLLWGDSASKWSKMGYQPNHRGFVMGHLMGKKGATSVVTSGSRPTLLLDSRTVGQNAAAHFAADGIQFVDDTVANGMLKSRVFTGLDPASASVIKNLRDLHLGAAGEQLLSAGAISRPSGMSEILGKLRPGALQDTLWATDNLAAGTVGKLHGWAGIPKIGRIGIGALALVGGVLGYKKLAASAAPEAQQQTPDASQAQGGAGQGASAQLSAEDQAALQQFASMTPEQQAQIIQSLYTQLQQAAQVPNMTADQQQQVLKAQQELQLLMQVAQQSSSAATAASGVNAQAGFTAQGLGL